MAERVVLSTPATTDARAATLLRPDRKLQRLVPFDPWDTRVLWD